MYRAIVPVANRRPMSLGRVRGLGRLGEDGGMVVPGRIYTFRFRVHGVLFEATMRARLADVLGVQVLGLDSGFFSDYQDVRFRWTGSSPIDPADLGLQMANALGGVTASVQYDSAAGQFSNTDNTGGNDNGLPNKFPWGWVVVGGVALVGTAIVFR